MKLADPERLGAAIDALAGLYENGHLAAAADPAAFLARIGDELERLRAVAADVQDSFDCTRAGQQPGDHLGEEDDPAECWNCYARWALEGTP